MHAALPARALLASYALMRLQQVLWPSLCLRSRVHSRNRSQGTRSASCTTSRMPRMHARSGRSMHVRGVAPVASGGALQLAEPEVPLGLAHLVEKAVLWSSFSAEGPRWLLRAVTGVARA